MTIKQEQAAVEFAERWAGKGYEKGESQKFWIDLLGSVFGVEKPTEWIDFEEQVHLDHTSFIDGHIRATHVLIEQKSLGKDLRASIKQSDGSMLTPFQQAKRYSVELPYVDRPRWIVTCNFSDFLIYDMNQPNGEPEHIELKNLGKEYYRLKFLVDTGDEHIKREMEISLQAGELVGKLYDKLLGQYKNPKDPETLKSLNKLCVRLVFCLYAEDAGVFPQHDQFHNFLTGRRAGEVREALMRLFQVLDTPIEERDPYMDEELSAFPYVNGGLFAEEKIEVPRFTDEIVTLMLEKASLGFDWSGISPTIFGAVFESTLNPDTRRSGGMHYTSIENIHKVIDPLFLDELREEYANATTDKALRALQNKISSLTFLDPACGSGNFLTETYISLRRIENDIIQRLNKNQSVLGFDAELSPIKVSISQFYGIEINDFAVTVARTALWIAEHQMLRETMKLVAHDLDFLPLKSYNNIREGDALKLDWCEIEEESVSGAKDIYAKNVNVIFEPASVVRDDSDVVYEKVNIHTKPENISFEQTQPQTYRHVDYDYIIGNPPFVGHQWRTPVQSSAMEKVFANWGTCGKLDYVAAWYKKASDIIKYTNTKCAFVSTNSICQGESVAILWKPMFDSGVQIDFAYKTFVWNSESTQKAHVHCVIIGFSSFGCGKKIIFDGNNKVEAKNINGYLLDAPNVFIQNRGDVLTAGLPKMSKGSQPTDGGNLLLSEEDKDELVKNNPLAEQWIHRYLGAEEFINNKSRYCLWLVGADPSELRKCPFVMGRVENVRAMRLKSPTKSVQRDADTPTLFTQRRQPETQYLVVPEVSSERRRYVPIGFMSPNIIASNTVYLVPDASLYMFGIMMSNVHNAWMRTVCGRMKSDYRYTPAVYNNFPWPSPTEAQKAKIEETAQQILDARALYLDCSLADLYDEAVMPVELRRAHQNNDRAVMQAYGFPVKNFSEQDCVARLMEIYKEMTK